MAVTITGKLVTASNTAAVLGSIEVMLCGYGSWVPRVNGVGLVARIQDPNLIISGDGSFSFQVQANDLIEPDGTYYTLTVKDDNGDVAQVNAYRFTGDGSTYDLNNTDPYNPNLPPPPLPTPSALIILGPADNMVFDGTTYLAFKTTLPGDVGHPVFQNMKPGNLYTFIIQQDATGGHTFAWAANVHNAPQIDATANGGTVVTFVADETGALWPIGPGTYYA